MFMFQCYCLTDKSYHVQKLPSYQDIQTEELKERPEEPVLSNPFFGRHHALPDRHTDEGYENHESPDLSFHHSDNRFKDNQVPFLSYLYNDKRGKNLEISDLVQIIRTFFHK